MSQNNSEQLVLCKKYSVVYFESPEYLKVGISKIFEKNKLPINGLRHPPEKDTAGWYIWSGEEFSEDPDFFLPIHTKHLKIICPQIIKYLGLPPGYRFLMGENNYEDVWEDLNLLDIK